MTTRPYSLAAAQWHSKLRQDPRVLSQPAHEIARPSYGERLTTHGRLLPMDCPAWADRHPYLAIVLSASALAVPILGGLVFAVSR